MTESVESTTPEAADPLTAEEITHEAALHAHCTRRLCFASRVIDTVVALDARVTELTELLRVEREARKNKAAF